MISCLALEMSRTISLPPALEDVLLERSSLLPDLAQHRERRVDAVVDDLVEQVAGALGESCSRQSSRVRQRSKRYSSGCDRLVGQRDDEVGTDEDVELGGVEAAEALVVAREVQDDEQVVVVLVDLRALVAAADVLVVERVEVEVLLQPRAVARRGARC